LYVACEKEGFVRAFGDILSFGGNFTDSIHILAKRSTFAKMLYLH